MSIPDGWDSAKTIFGWSFFILPPVVSRASPRDAAPGALENDFGDNILQKQASYAIIKQTIAEVWRMKYIGFAPIQAGDGN